MRETARWECASHNFFLNYEDDNLGDVFKIIAALDLLFFFFTYIIKLCERNFQSFCKVSRNLRVFLRTPTSLERDRNVKFPKQQFVALVSLRARHYERERKKWMAKSAPLFFVCVGVWITRLRDLCENDGVVAVLLSSWSRRSKEVDEGGLRQAKVKTLCGLSTKKRKRERERKTQGQCVFFIIHWQPKYRQDRGPNKEICAHAVVCAFFFKTSYTLRSAINNFIFFLSRKTDVILICKRSPVVDLLGRAQPQQRWSASLLL